MCYNFQEILKKYRFQYTVEPLATYFVKSTMNPDGRLRLLTIIWLHEKNLRYFKHWSPTCTLYMQERWSGKLSCMYSSEVYWAFQLICSPFES